MTRSRDAIRREIASIDAALAESERQREEMRARLEGLRAELAVPASSTPPLVMAAVGPADSLLPSRSLSDLCRGVP
jgi:hypothetical protein